MPAADANGTTTNANDSQVPSPPDLDEDDFYILNERRTWEELQRIKAMPIPMAQKRMLKSLLANLPIVQLKGWSHVKYVWRRHRQNLQSKLNYVRRRMIFMNQSLRAIELHVGTAIANVFLFIKWTMFLNIATSLCMLSFVIAPYITYELIQGGKKLSPADPTTCSATDEGSHLDLENVTVRKRFLDCCRAKYEEHLDKESDDFEKLFGGAIEFWPIHMSFYHEPFISFDGFETRYAFSTAYVLTGFLILACCLIFVVHNIAQGVKEVIKLKEGEFYKYSNLVFTGWEHFTNDLVGANFKRKMLRDEMKQLLHMEKKKITNVGKSQKENFKVILLRAFVNVTVIGLLIGAGFTIFYLSLKFRHKGTGNDNEQQLEAAANVSTNDTLESEESEAFEELVKQFSVPFVISFFNLIFPIILTRLGKLENHSREVEIALVLMRSLFIRIFSIYALAAVYYQQTYCRPMKGYCTKCDRNGTESNQSDNPDPENVEIKDRIPCWEGEFAKQIYQLIVTELAIKVVLTFTVDPFRKLVGRCCKNKLGAKIGRLNFNIVRHSLDILYIQILAWISFYVAPFMPLATALYCFLIFYVKKFSVMHNVNHVPDAFRTTRTTAVFMVAKIISFVIILFTFAFVVAYMAPSRECGPFRGRPTAWSAVEEEFEHFPWIYSIIDAFFPGVAIPVVLVLILLAYYYYSVAHANRSMVETLRHLLILEGHDKQYLFDKLNSLQLPDPPKNPPMKLPDIETTIFRDPKLNKRLSIISNRLTTHMAISDKISKVRE